jgi:uncharacterized protein (DUF302 family)
MALPANRKIKGGIVSKTNNGISQILSIHPVRDVLARLLSLLRAKGITVFAVVDHSGEAAKAGFA